MSSVCSKHQGGVLQLHRCGRQALPMLWMALLVQQRNGVWERTCTGGFISVKGQIPGTAIVGCVHGSYTCTPASMGMSDLRAASVKKEHGLLHAYDMFKLFWVEQGWERLQQGIHHQCLQAYLPLTQSLRSSHYMRQLYTYTYVGCLCLCTANMPVRECRILHSGSTLPAYDTCQRTVSYNALVKECVSSASGGGGINIAMVSLCRG